MGSNSVIPLLNSQGPTLASDLNEALITMYQSIQSGWVPESINRETWEDLRLRRDPKDPRTALAGFGFSFFGGWFSRYVCETEKSGPGLNGPVIRPLLKRMSKCKNTEFKHCDYRDLKPEGWIIWADPPYEGTREYDATGSFNTVDFWGWARLVSESNILLVSGYKAPEDFECVWKFDRTSSKRRDSARESEKLFRLRESDLFSSMFLR